MNEPRLLELLRAGVADARSHGPFEHETYWAARRLLGFRPTASAETRRQIVEVLRDEPEFRVFDGQYQTIGTHTSSIDLDSLATWLVWRSLHTSPEQALADLRRYVREDEIPVAHVMVLGGAYPVQDTTFTNGVEFMLFKHAPDSVCKEQFRDFCIPPFGIDGALSALVVRAVERKRHTADLPTDGPTAEESERIRTMLEDAALCLTLGGPSWPVEIGSYTAVEERIPSSGIGLGYSIVIGHGYIGGPKGLSLADLEEARRVHERFLGLEEPERERLRLPIRRLNSALRRSSETDWAIDLGVALELALLFDRGGDRGELATTLRLRGARYLGMNAEERLEYSELLKKVYQLRSAAAHTGRLPPTIGKNEYPRYVLHRGSVAAAAILKKQVIEGKPDWDRVMFA